MPAILITCSLAACAQQQTYHLITFTPPAGWKKGDLKNVISFSTTNNTTRTCAQIGILKAQPAKVLLKPILKANGKS